MPGERDSRWLGALTLSVCTGAAVYLMTGEGDKGFFIAMLLSIILTLVIAFSPGGGKASAKELHWAGVVVLVGPFLLMMVGYHGRRGRPPAWEDLQARYTTKGPEPSGLEAGREVVVNRMVGQFMVQPYTHKRVYTHFGDGGAYLSLSFPMSWVYDPVLVPIKSIRECRRDSMKSGYATLALLETAIEIDVADDAGQVRAWCEHHGIPDSPADAE